ncbi:MAG: hypothetical protein U0R52_04405 [Solirubrobacterales bacterium]
MTTTKTRNRFARTAIATALAATALAAVPAAGQAATKFGSDLNPTMQPSNSLPAHPCTHQDAGKSCTRIETVSYGNPGHERAPKTGTIRKIRVIAGGPGSFRLQIAKVKVDSIGLNNTAKVLRNGPVIHYQGQTQQNWDSDVYRVESFRVNVPVHKGEYLAMRSRYTSALRCSSGGDNQLIYQPSLLAGGGFQNASSTDGCWMLLQAVVK